MPTRIKYSGQYGVQHCIEIRLSTNHSLLIITQYTVPIDIVVSIIRSREAERGLKLSKSQSCQLLFTAVGRLFHLLTSSVNIMSFQMIDIRLSLCSVVYDATTQYHSSPCIDFAALRQSHHALDNSHSCHFISGICSCSATFRDRQACSIMAKKICRLQSSAELVR